MEVIMFMVGFSFGMLAGILLGACLYDIYKRGY